MKQYCIEKVNSEMLSQDAVWNGIPIAGIDHYAWGGVYQPFAAAQIVRTSDAFHLRMEALEPYKNMRITKTGASDNICQDSCLEFFLSPSPDSDQRYLNFEINPAGALLVEIGPDRFHRSSISKQCLPECTISPFIRNTDTDSSLVRWGFNFCIPFSYIQSYFHDFDPSSRQQLRCNFYKCGDSTPVPHYGSWNPIETDTPDFHRPEFFGQLIM